MSHFRVLFVSGLALGLHSTAFAFSPSTLAPVRSRIASPNLALARNDARHQIRSKRLVMSSATMDDFDKGGAEPIGAIEKLDALVPRKEITALIKQSSDVEGLKQVAWHVGCFLVCATAFAAFKALALAPLAWIAMLGMAFVHSFNFMALHETVHRSAFKSRVLNDVVMQIAGFLTLRPAFHYFYYHWQHHKHTGDPAKDSELQPSLLDMDVSTIPGYLAYISGIPFWFDAVSTTIKHALGSTEDKPYINTEKAKTQVVMEARAYLALYASLIIAGTACAPLGAGLLTYWVLPALFGQPFLRFYLFGEHRGCQETTNVLQNTRTMSTNWFYSKMAWHMPFHLEHHAWPYVPFHKLGAANKLVTAAGGWSNESCAPTGEKGYLGMNLQFLKDFLPKKGDKFPSGAA